MKKILKESGLRNIKELSKRYPKAKIYFHQDLDGVTTALAMKNYLENNGIKVVDSEIIQYGDKEFAVKKMDAKGDTMPVLVDFAHGKPMFVVHTDHHDSQTGVEGDTSTSFRSSRSNVETLSQIMSPSDIFPSEDVTLISTVDSADFARFGLEPQDIMNFIFKVQKDKGLQKNKMALGLATNKLLLAYKNKPKFLEKLVMSSTPSLLNIFQNINRIAQEEGYASPEEMNLNQQGYVSKQKDSEKVTVDDSIIVQYGGGSMFKPGSYDRYTPFKNNPDADFLVIAWPMGLVQASCNPFKGERELKGVNLGEIAQEVLAKWESQLKEKIIPLSTIKWVSESNKGFDEESVGFTNADLEAFYGDKVRSIDGGDEYMERLKNIMDKPFNDLTDSEWAILDKLGVPAWEMVQANSGGHKCITNISALNYFGRSKRPPSGKKSYGKKEGDAPYVKFVKMIQRRFVEILKEKIDGSKKKSVTESAKDLRDSLRVLGYKEKGNEISNNGEITDELSDKSSELFRIIKKTLPKVNIKVTAGNDRHHRRINNSLHPRGKALDFTVKPKKYIDQVETLLRIFKNNTPNFRYNNEYVNKSKNWTGGHFHISYDNIEKLDLDVKPITTKINTPILLPLPPVKLPEFKDTELRLIGRYSRGEDVKLVQQILIDLGYDLGQYGTNKDGVDGIFGKKTQEAVKKYQSDNNLKMIDGIVGPETYGSLLS
jgi:hypothetical protein